MHTFGRSRLLSMRASQKFRVFVPIRIFRLFRTGLWKSDRIYCRFRKNALRIPTFWSINNFQRIIPLSQRVIHLGTDNLLLRRMCAKINFFPLPTTNEPDFDLPTVGTPIFTGSTDQTLSFRAPTQTVDHHFIVRHPFTT